MHQIKQRLRDAVGEHITCFIGYALNRCLAKIAANLDWPTTSAVAAATAMGVFCGYVPVTRGN